MAASIQKYRATGAGEIVSLNIEDLDVVELERRMEMSVALAAADFCGVNHSCTCTSLTSCNTFCS